MAENESTFSIAELQDLGSTPVEQALEIINRYGGIDGGHHKQWVLDQVVRVLTENQGGYLQWLAQHCDGEDGPETYGWDEGIAP
jgi:hypothetical protein